MVHRAGIKRVYVPLPLSDWQFLRHLAATRRTSMAGELSTIARTELERQRLLHAKQSRYNGHSGAIPDGERPESALEVP